MTKWRGLYFLTTTVVLAFAYAWFFGYQTLLMDGAWLLVWKAPVVRITPAQILNSAVAPGPGTKLSYFGYKFEVPWDDVDGGMGRVNPGKSAKIVCRSGLTLVLLNGPPHEFANTMLSSLQVQRGNLEQSFGAAFQSDYEVHRLIWEASPTNITPFVARQEAVREMLLLTIKAISAPRGAENGVFAVTTPDFKGFQFGRPQNSSNMVDVELFSDNGSLDFIFLQKLGGPTVLTQGDMNRVLRTLQKDSDSAGNNGSSKTR